MNEIKVSVSIILQGRVLLTQEEAETLEKEQPGTGFENHTQIVTDSKNKKNKHIIHYSTVKQKTVMQSIKFCKEAYKYMTAKDYCPEWEKMKNWSTMSKKQRLESHIKRLMEHLGGISYSYKIFED